jgi:hypothetical protein
LGLSSLGSFEAHETWLTHPRRAQETQKYAVISIAVSWRYHGTQRVSSKKAMSNTTQQEYLKSAKDALGVTWDELAELSGINPRALKTYRMPDTSQDYRQLPSLARAAIDRLVVRRKKKVKVIDLHGTHCVP